MSSPAFYLQTWLTQYHENLGYDTANGGAGDADAAAKFIEACRGLLTIPSQSGKGSAHQQFDASNIRKALERAEKWFHANSAAAKRSLSASQPRHPDFSDFRREGGC